MEVVNKPVTSKVAWIGADLNRSDDWVTRWSETELSELDRAIKEVHRRGLQAERFTVDDFPLPKTAARLSWIRDELLRGRGFVLMRGLDVERYSEEDLRTLYWGLSVHLGTVMSQNARGTLIERVTDIGSTDLKDPNLRLYVTAAEQPPHADLADVVGLLCVDRADTGGESVVVSMMSIYNRILVEHPEYLPCLFDGFFHDLRGEGPTGELDETSDVRVPVFSRRNGKLYSWFHGRKLRYGAPKRGIALSPLQREAIDYVEGLGRDPAMRLDMQLQRGDLQLLNNYTALHYRTAFVDGGGHKRLMLRIWINLDELAEELDPAVVKWVRAGVPKQEWAATRPVAAIGER